MVSDDEGKLDLGVFSSAESILGSEDSFSTYPDSQIMRPSSIISLVDKCGPLNRLRRSAPAQFSKYSTLSGQARGFPMAQTTERPAAMLQFQFADSMDDEASPDLQLPNSQDAQLSTADHTGSIDDQPRSSEAADDKFNLIAAHNVFVELRRRRAQQLESVKQKKVVDTVDANTCTENHVPQARNASEAGPILPEARNREACLSSGLVLAVILWSTGLVNILASGPAFPTILGLVLSILCLSTVGQDSKPEQSLGKPVVVDAPKPISQPRSRLDNDGAGLASELHGLVEEVNSYDVTSNILRGIKLLASGGSHETYLLTFMPESVTDEDIRELPLLNTELGVRIRRPAEWSREVAMQVRNEVGLREFLRQNHPSVPTPRIYAFDDGELGGTAYIAEENVQGENMGHAWNKPSTTYAEKESMIQQLGMILADMVSIRFPKIGGFGPFEQGIVSHTENCMMDRGRSEYCDSKAFNRGPYSSRLEYVSAMLDNETLVLSDAIRQGPEQLGRIGWTQAYISRYGSPERFLTYLTVTKTDLEAAAEKSGMPYEEFVISHGDLAGRKIMVKDGRITHILDWEWAAVMPYEEFFTRLGWERGPLDYVCTHVLGHEAAARGNEYMLGAAKAEVENQHWHARLLKTMKGRMEQANWEELDMNMVLHNEPMHDGLVPVREAMMPDRVPNHMECLKEARKLDAERVARDEAEDEDVVGSEADNSAIGEEEEEGSEKDYGIIEPGDSFVEDVAESSDENYGIGLDESPKNSATPPSDAGNVDALIEELLEWVAKSEVGSTTQTDADIEGDQEDLPSSLRAPVVEQSVPRTAQVPPTMQFGQTLDQLQGFDFWAPPGLFDLTNDQEDLPSILPAAPSALAPSHALSQTRPVVQFGGVMEQAPNFDFRTPPGFFRLPQVEEVVKSHVDYRGQFFNLSAQLCESNEVSSKQVEVLTDAVKGITPDSSVHSVVEGRATSATPSLPDNLPATLLSPARINLQHSEKPKLDRKAVEKIVQEHEARKRAEAEQEAEREMERNKKRNAKSKAGKKNKKLRQQAKTDGLGS